jgi:methylenetetrahydrofolate reductase (NADPH)
MRIDEILTGRDAPVLSFEFFPPRTDEGERKLGQAVERLAALEPDFFSVTWGAGGSTSERTVSLTAELQERFGPRGMAHLTCVGASVDSLHASVRAIRDAGIDNVLALRGDPPAGEEAFVKRDDGLAHASELAKLVSDDYDLFVAGACYPETHQEAPDALTDVQHLRRKVDAGASVLITQLFYDNRDYFALVESARDHGIDVPIIPGILPATDQGRLERITGLCGARIPEPLHAQMVACEGPESVRELGIAYAAQQCAELLAAGAPGIHFYTINDAGPTAAIVGALRAARPWERAWDSRQFAMRSR